MAEFCLRAVEAGTMAQWLVLSTHGSCRGPSLHPSTHTMPLTGSRLWLQLEGVQLLLASKNVPIHMHIKKDNQKAVLDRSLCLLQWVLISGPLLHVDLLLPSMLSLGFAFLETNSLPLDLLCWNGDLWLLPHTYSLWIDYWCVPPCSHQTSEEISPYEWEEELVRVVNKECISEQLGCVFMMQ